MYNIGGGDKCDLMKFRLTELAVSSGLPSFLDLFYNITVSIIIITSSSSSSSSSSGSINSSRNETSVY